MGVLPTGLTSDAVKALACSLATCQAFPQPRGHTGWWEVHCDACGTAVPHVHKLAPVLSAACVKVTEAEAQPSSLSKHTARQGDPNGSAVWGAWRVPRSAFCRACPLSTGEGGLGQGPWSYRAMDCVL